MQMVCATRYSGFFLCFCLPADQPYVVCTPSKAQRVFETIAQSTHIEDVRTHGAALLGSEICRQLPHDCLILVVRKFAGIHVGWVFLPGAYIFGICHEPEEPGCFVFL